MSVLRLMIWVVYGLIVGSVVRMIHPGKESGGTMTTLAIGVAGSFTGGFINWIIGGGTSPLQASGLIFGIIGGLIFLSLWNYWKKISNSN